MDKKEIGQQLKIFRKRLGYTQAELAELVGIHEKHLSRIESGINFPTFENFIKIMNALNIEFKDFKSHQKDESKNSIKKEIISIINFANKNDLKIYLAILKDLQKSNGSNN